MNKDRFLVTILNLEEKKKARREYFETRADAWKFIDGVLREWKSYPPKRKVEIQLYDLSLRMRVA